jgi:hypothetical protein
MIPCKIHSYPPADILQGEEEVLGKFVQFHWRGVEYLLFATKAEHRFHNQMLARFLAEHGLPHRWLDDETLSIEVDDLQVIGGGRFRLASHENLLELWDNSQAYGRFDEGGLPERIRRAGHPWSASRVVIR